MADVSKLILNGVSYNIKDATARNNIESVRDDLSEDISAVEQGYKSADNTINGRISSVEGASQNRDNALSDSIGQTNSRIDGLNEDIEANAESIDSLKDRMLSAETYLDVAKTKNDSQDIDILNLNRNVGSLSTLTNGNSEEIATLKNRMDTFASLPSGSTTGDAELIDIRNGIDGVRYSSAGNAVRAQANMLQKTIYQNTKMLKDKSKGMQYADADKINMNYRYPSGTGSEPFLVSATDYGAFDKILNIPAGTYYFDYVYDAFTIIENCETHALVMLNSITGAVSHHGNIGVGSVTLDYNYNLYLTRNYNQDWIGHDTYWCDNSSLPSAYAYGEYDTTLEEIYHLVNVVGSSNYTNLLPDINNADNNRIYTLLFSDGSTTIPLNYPLESFKGTINTLICIGGVGFAKTQILVAENFYAFRRTISATSWSSWNVIETNEIYHNFNHLILANNYDTYLPDLNSAEHNTVYHLVLSDGSTTIPANYPFTTYRGTVNTLITFGNSLLGLNDSQIILSDTFYAYRRRASTNVWGNWRTVNFERESSSIGNVYIVSADGTGDFTTIKEGLEEAISSPNSVVYIRKGTYDILAELGNDYLDDIDGTDERVGLQLGNGVHVIASSDAKIVCNYTGSNTNVNRCLSVFNAKTSSFTLENVNIEAKNIRYCVHDEHHSDANQYYSKFKNCNMSIDNTNNPVWSNSQCIGGGLGSNGEIIIEDCYFYSPNATRNTGVVSYHNSASREAKSKIVVKGCYFDGNNSTVRFGYYGASEKITDCLIHGNSFSAEPYLRAENSTAQNINMRMYTYNNSIR